MSDNVGLSTPRGSGTSGYVQRNLAHMKPRDRAAPYHRDLDHLKHRQRQPDKGILEHDRKREIEVKVFELRDQLEDEGYVNSLQLIISTLRQNQPTHLCTPAKQPKYSQKITNTTLPFSYK